SFEASGPGDGGVLAAAEVVGAGRGVHADLLDRRLKDLQAGPAMSAGPAIGLLLEARDVGVEERLCGRARLHAPRADAADAVGVGAHDLLVERECRAD